MADKYLNLTVLTYFWNKIKVLFNSKVNNTDIASETTLGLIKTNPDDHITVDSNGTLYVEGRLGQSHTSTGMYAPATIEPSSVGDGSLLITEASGTKLGNKSLAVSTGSNLTLKTTASAGATQYIVANNYQNRIICAGAVGGVVALNEASSDTTANIISVQINGANFTPDSSANDSTNNIIITVDESINPNSSTSSIRIYANEGSGYSNLFVGQQVGGNGGASVIVGQKVFSNSGNACAMVGADMYNAGNGNALFGRQHISKKNRWFMSGTGHDNSSGRSESGAAIGQWSDIQSDTIFAIGNGTSHTARSNAFEVLNDGRVKANGTPSESDDLVNKDYVDNTINNLDTTVSGAGAGKTLNTLTETNGVISATFQNISITKSQVSDFPTSMTPASHTHGYIKNDGTVEQSAVASGDRIVITDNDYGSKIVKSNITFDGTTTNQFLSKKGTWQTPSGIFRALNTGSILASASSTSAKSWTATADCICIVATRGSDYANRIKINNVQIERFGMGEAQMYTIPLKKGQTLYIGGSDYNTGYVAFAIQ